MKKLLVLAAVLALSGCAVNKNWTPTGGSKADGVVRLSYQVKEMEQPILNEEEAIALATRRCASWGYSGAEAFGGTTSQCIQGGGFGGCSQRQVTKEYQCTGELAKKD